MQVATGKEPKLPKAANMRELKWDNDLALVAQRWADQCDFNHDALDAKSAKIRLRN